MAGQAFERGLQSGVPDAARGLLEIVRSLGGQLWRRAGCVPGSFGGLDLEQDAVQACECLHGLQLALQTALLVAQAGGPVPIGDDEQQCAFAPGGDVAVLARSGLQLAFNQMLQAIEPSCLAEQGLQRLCFAQQRGGRSGWRGAQRHGGIRQWW